MDSIISKDYTFDAAHMLPLHKGKCRNLHGHTYKVRVSVRGPIQEDGMVLDFGVLSEAVKPIIASFDHSFIVGTWNDPQNKGLANLVRLCLSSKWKVKWIQYPHTTAENIALNIREEVIFNLKEQAKWSTGLMVSVAVWETPKASAETDWEYA